MNDPKRAIVLLRAAYELLKSCDDGPYVKNALSEVVHYDDADCDGFCLMEDIEAWLDDNTGEPK